MLDEIVGGLLREVAIVVVGAVFGLLFVIALIVIITPYVLVAAAIQDGPYKCLLVQKYKRSIKVFRNIWNSCRTSHREDQSQSE